MNEYKIYLAGAMETYVGTNYAKEWRDECKKWFDENCENVKCISPVDYYNYTDNNSKSGLEIMRFDLHKIKESNLLMVNMASLRKTIGTSDEIFYAWMLGKPVIGFVNCKMTDEKLEHYVHPWKYWQSTRIKVGKNAMKKTLQYIKDYYLR